MHLSVDHINCLIFLNVTLLTVINDREVSDNALADPRRTLPTPVSFIFMQFLT